MASSSSSMVVVGGEKELNVDPNVWKACAGSSVEIPVVGSLVYYFIEGHVEHAAGTNLKYSSMNCTKPYVLCKIVYVRFLANPETDEVFMKMGLEPSDGSGGTEILPPPPVTRQSRGGGGRSNRRGEEDDNAASKIVSFAKILTISDANNGGGFSVPRFCADSIFPELNYKVEPPVQTISLRDVHGMVWEFRHIYRGTPRRHLLTTGWSKFVNHKKLVAYDSVVFMKNGVGELFVGIRRYLKKSEGVENGRWSNPNVSLEGGDGFSRRSTGRVSAQSVLEAVKLALENKPFEIVSYPKAGSPAFVVKAETVDASMNTYWTSGMRIKTAVESEDSSRMTWFQGTISSVAMQNSPWCMLQVTWDEPELHSLKRVSPWQVELVATNPSLQAPFPPTKRQRLPQDPGFLTDEKGGLFFPMTGLTNSMTGPMNSPLFSYNNFPASMQGARHDPICVSKLSNYMGNNNHNMLPSEHISGNSTSLTLSSTATELSIRNTSQSENMSPNSQGSVHFVGSEFFGNQTCNTATKAGNGTMLLFGKIIHTYQPVEAGINDGKGTKDDGSRGNEETEGVINPLNPSLSYPCKQLCDGLDVQFKSVPALKQFLL